MPKGVGVQIPPSPLDWLAWCHDINATCQSGDNLHKEILGKRQEAMLVIIRLLGFLKSYWKWVVLAYACLFVSVAFSMGVPKLIQLAIDTGIAVDLQTGEVSGNQRFLILAGIAIVAVSLLRGGFAFGQTYLGEFISQRVAYDIRHLIYDRIQRLSFAFHDKAETGQLMSRATQDVEAVRMFVSRAPSVSFI